MVEASSLSPWVTMFRVVNVVKVVIARVMDTEVVVMNKEDNHLVAIIPLPYDAMYEDRLAIRVVHRIVVIWSPSEVLLVPVSSSTVTTARAAPRSILEAVISIPKPKLIIQRWCIRAL